jgi:hypothetical protein
MMFWRLSHVFYIDDSPSQKTGKWWMLAVGHASRRHRFPEPFSSISKFG